METLTHFIITLIISYFIANSSRVIIEDEVLSRFKLAKGAPRAFATLFQYFILLLGTFAAIGVTGINLDKFSFIAGTLGVGIGFGLQNIVSNFISGVILLVERPIKIGDTVEVGALKGIISEIGIRSCKVRTFTGAEVIVPNTNLISNEVINWTLKDSQKRMEIPVKVEYGTDPRHVVEILSEVVVKHPEILEDPGPMVLFKGFGEYSLDFRVLCWAEDNWLSISSEMALMIHERLLEEGIKIPVPKREVQYKAFESQSDIPQAPVNEKKDLLATDNLEEGNIDRKEVDDS